MLKIVFLGLCLYSLTGCSTVSYYSQVINGHYALIENEEDIEDILAEKRYSADVRQRLQRALEIRRFASEQLGLPDNDSYKTFVKLKHKYPVWNVIAAEPLSVKARQWCFLFVGCISYRGYFNEQDAKDMAAELHKQGYDVTVSPAAAYSTLGWFDDPLLSSMLYKEESHLAGIIFHELAHQKVYIDDDSSFNEAFATTVELEGVKRWMRVHGDTASIKRYRTYKQRQKEFNQLLITTREKLKRLYASEKTDAEKLQGKQAIIAAMKQDYQALKKSWGGYSGYDNWMARDINNANLALVATYHELVPMFEAMLKQQDYDLKRFYAAVEKTGELPEEERDREFKLLAKQALGMNNE